MTRTSLTLALLALVGALAVRGHVRQRAEQTAGQKDLESQGRSFLKQVPQKQAAQKQARHDHVGKPLPEFMTGDQCLFCHRFKTGATWEKDSHSWTIRPVGEPPEVPRGARQPPSDATHVLGSMQHVRALKLTGYGQFAILASDGKTWQQPGLFATRCAGCHASGVDPATHAFSSFGLDCYACHGDVQLTHSSNPSEVLFSSKRARQPREIASICGQCHLRGGRSESTGLPYPNNFVAGDDLFEDFQADLKRADDTSLDYPDRHVYFEVRNVLERGSTTTCLDCHKIHGDATLKHVICVDCDDAAGAGKNEKPAKMRSPACDY